MSTERCNSQTFFNIRFLLFAALIGCLTIPSTTADDTFTCCMAGWKSVRSVIMCPRPCCDGYSLRSALVPALGPVTYCSKEAVIIIPPAKVSPPETAKPPASIPLPQKAAAKSRPNRKSQLRLRRVFEADGPQEAERSRDENKQPLGGERLICSEMTAASVSSD